ncbi:hypothetical protein Tco_0170853 [Tanacetum coccineum]
MVKTGLVEAIDSLVPLDEHLATFRGRTSKLQNGILMFQQHQGESLSEARTRFKDLLQKVPHLPKGREEDGVEKDECRKGLDHYRLSRSWPDMKTKDGTTLSSQRKGALTTRTPT